MALIMGLMMLSAVVVAATIHVPTDQPTIQAGINAAVDGDTVLVAPGDYYESDISLQGKGIILSSHYMLDGDTMSIALTRLVDTTFNSAWSMYPRIRCSSGEGPNTVVNGFTLLGKHRGIDIANSSPTITNNWFYSYIRLGDGGGIMAVNSQSIIRANRFSHEDFLHAPDRGGGIYAASSSLRILNNDFLSCESSDKGAGIFLNSCDSTIVYACLLQGNLTGDGAAIFVASSTYTLIDSCRFEDNRAAGETSGIVTGGSLEIRRSTFVSGPVQVISAAIRIDGWASLQADSIIGFSYGIYLDGSATIIESIITSNMIGAKGQGGPLRISNSQITDNAEFGVRMDIGVLVIDSCVLQRNGLAIRSMGADSICVRGSLLLGDAIYAQYITRGIDVANNTLGHVNFSETNIGVIQNNIIAGGLTLSPSEYDPDTVLVRFNDSPSINSPFAFLGDTTWGVNIHGVPCDSLYNISRDPAFADTTAGDYSLLWNSPCIDAGNPDSLLNDPDGTPNDIGAYYFEHWIETNDVLVDGSLPVMNVINHSPQISWRYQSWPEFLSQSKFEIAVGTDSEWTYSEMWNPAPFNSSDTFVVYNGSTLVDGVTYWLRLRVNNSLAWSDWKQLMFRMNSIPTIPQLRLPLAESIVPSQQPGLIIRNSTDAESDSLIYTFEVSPDAFAMTVFTFSKPQDADSLTMLIVDSTLIENGQYWWRVRASDYYESSEYSAVRSFYVNSSNTAPTAVSLTQPVNTIIAPVTILRPQFIWTSASDPDPMDSITYDLVIAIDSNFVFVQQIPNLTVVSHTLTSDLLWGTRYWWKVKSLDRQGAFNWSPVFTFRTMTLGDANNDGVTNISDAVYLIAYIFSGGLPPNPLILGDANCDGAVNISDAVYLIAYIFAGGLAPCSEF